MPLFLPRNQMFRRFLQEYKGLYATWLIIVAIGALWAVVHDRGDAIRSLNTYYSPFTVQFFTLFTRVAEWSGFVIPFIYLLLFRTIRQQIGYALVGLLVLIFVTVLKEYVFSSAIRPISFFEQMGIDIANKPDVTLNRKHSFPSGHTTAGFAYFFYLALATRREYLRYGFLFVAICIGISRVFLIQHFMIDVLAGSVLGVSIASFIYYFVVDQKVWGNKKLDEKFFS